MNLHIPIDDPIAGRKLRKKFYDRKRKRDLRVQQLADLKAAGVVRIRGHNIQKPLKAPEFKDHPQATPAHVSLEELTRLSCRFPYGDGPFTFCGCETQEGRVYCGPHHELTHQKGVKDAASQ